MSVFGQSRPSTYRKTLQIIFIHGWGMGKWGLVGLLYLLLCLVVAAKLTDLANPPEWERLDSFQKSITKYEFSKQLNEVYCRMNLGGHHGLRSKKIGCEFVKMPVGGVV